MSFEGAGKAAGLEIWRIEVLFFINLYYYIQYYILYYIIINNLYTVYVFCLVLHIILVFNWDFGIEDIELKDALIIAK